MPPSRFPSHLWVAIVISAMVIYNAGSFTHCTPSWSGGFSSGSTANPSSHTHSNMLQRIHSSKHSNETKSLPYSCGIVHFYHIPSTGGASINKWLLRYSDYKYYTMWGIEVDKTGQFHKNPKKIENSFIDGMSEHVKGLGSNEWRIAHSHILSINLDDREKELLRWRHDVESQGCHMINAVMLREPLSHAMSLYKVMDSKNGTRAEWAKHLLTPTTPGKWATQLDFFLYNNFGVRNPHGLTKEEKVRRGLELLEKHFDIVAVANHEFFVSELLNLTGWDFMPMIRTNVHRGELTFTKKEVESLDKLLAANGDIDFYDAVKIRYTGALSYV